MRDGPEVGVSASGLAARGPGGPVFEGVSFEARPGALVAVVGPAGAGRGPLLLALAGRLRPVAGRVRVGDAVIPGGAAAVRELVAVARIPPAIDLEPRLRVDELRRERTALVPAARPAAQDAALRLVGIAPQGEMAAGDLHPRDALLLAVALAVAEGRPALVVDDVDGGLGDADRAAAWAALRRVAGTGRTVIAGAAAAPAGVAVDVAVALPHPTASAA